MSGFTSSTNIEGIRDTRSKFKALYIYSIATYIEWPSEYRKGMFIIEVYDQKNGLYDALVRDYNGKSIGSQEIKIVKYNPATKNKSHILYVSKENSTKLTRIETSLKNKSTLLISDRPGDLDKGATINFIIENNKQCFEIDKSNAKKHDLILASRLNTLALRVKKWFWTNTYR